MSRLVGNGGWGQLLKNKVGEKQQGTEDRPGRLCHQSNGKANQSRAATLPSAYRDTTALTTATHRNQADMLSAVAHS